MLTVRAVTRVISHDVIRRDTRHACIAAGPRDRAHVPRGWGAAHMSLTCRTQSTSRKQAPNERRIVQRRRYRHKGRYRLHMAEAGSPVATKGQRSV